MTAPSLSRHMGLLLNNEIDYDCNDIVIKFDDETAPKLKAHRCILSARSAVFKAMLKSCMSEATTGEILIHDIDFVVMQELLTYMYTDSCSSKDAFEILVEQLLFASTKYQVLGLLHQCEEHFIHQLNSKTVLTILEMADVYNASMLKEAALQFIVQNSHAITKTNEYIQLNKDLQDEVKRAIDDSIRRKGCREAIECGERRLMRTCVIM
jgi:speckle-type POZ protein